MMTVEELLSSYDWENVFAEEGCGGQGNVSSDLHSVDGTSIECVTRQDVAEVLASRDGENDVESWVGVFRLNDGRYLFASGWCDYTGWD